MPYIVLYAKIWGAGSSCSPPSLHRRLEHGGKKKWSDRARDCVISITAPTSCLPVQSVWQRQACSPEYRGRKQLLPPPSLHQQHQALPVLFAGV